MIGYVLLVSIALVMAGVVTIWLKTYVPKDVLECPDTTSIFIKEYSCQGNELNITVRNNGNFNVAGYFIRIANVSPEQELATTDLSSKLKSDFGGILFGNSILFSEEKGNSLAPNEESKNVFDITGTNTLYFVELVPIRFEEENNKQRTASCGNAKVREEITCT